MKIKEPHCPKYLKKQRERSIFKIGFALYLVILAVLISVGLAVFYRFMDAYENSRPERQVEKLLDGKGPEWVDELLAGCATEFEDAGTIRSTLFDKGVSDSFSFRKRVGEYSAETPVYTVDAGGVSFARVELCGARDGSFGFTQWEVKSVTAALDMESAGKIKITAPSDAAVSVNGIVLDEEYITEARVEYPGVGAFEAGVETTPHRKTYTVDGLMLTPEIEVTRDGRPVEMTESERGSYVYGKAPEFTAFAEAAAPSDASVYINGILLTADHLTGESVPYSLLDDAMGYASPMADRVVYRVEGLSKAPTVEARSQDGRTLPVEYTDGGRVVFDYPASDVTAAECSGWTEEFVRAYISFTAQGYVNTDANFRALAGAYLMNGSAAYDYMLAFKEGVKWNNPYDVTYRSLKLEDFIPYGDNCFSCRASFDVTFSTYGIENRYSGRLRLLAVRASDGWRIAGMELQS